jgi:hypothetical protein
MNITSFRRTWVHQNTSDIFSLSGGRCFSSTTLLRFLGKYCPSQTSQKRPSAQADVSSDQQADKIAVTDNTKCHMRCPYVECVLFIGGDVHFHGRLTVYGPMETRPSRIRINCTVIYILIHISFTIEGEANFSTISFRFQCFTPKREISSKCENEIALGLLNTVIMP